MATAKKNGNGNGKLKANGKPRTNGKPETNGKPKDNRKPKTNGKPRDTLARHANGTWSPGQSGNPPGGSRAVRERARMLPILRELGENYAIESVLTDEKGDKREIHIKSRNPIYHGIMAKLLQMALSGNLDAIKVILDRVDGKPTQSVFTTTSGAPEGSQKWLISGREIVF